MDWWTEVRLVTEAFLDQHGLTAAFLVLLIEEAGVPIPIPGDFLMLVLGVQARQGGISVWQAIVVMQLATMLGATFLYAISRWGGRPLVYRYGRFIRLSPERLDRAEQWIERHGFMAVFLGRLLPGLRIVTAVASGVFRVPVWIFVPAMSLGAALYIVVYTLLGYFFGPPVLALLEHLHLPLGLVGSLLVLGLLVMWVQRARRSTRHVRRHALEYAGHTERLRAGALAGGLATIVSTLVMNVLVNVAGNVALRSPGILVDETAARLALALAHEAQPLLLLVALPAYVAVGILWGALYGGWAAQRLPRDGRPDADWLHGLLFSLLPLATSLVVVVPLLGFGLLGWVVTGPVLAISEAVRHAAYGGALGLAYPVFLARRRVRVLPHTPADLRPGDSPLSAAGE